MQNIDCSSRLKNLTTLIVCSLILLSKTMFAAEIYKWTDKDGKVHYSDTPPENQKSRKIDSEKLEKSISSVSFVKVELLPIKIAVNRQSNQVVMYSTSWCKYCAKARRYFNKNNIDYTEVNIEQSAEARKEFDEVDGRVVPLILVGKYKITGFNQKKFSKIYRELFDR